MLSDWDGIRPEYFKIWADFPKTARPFGITLSPQQLVALQYLLIGMDLIDSAIDRVTERPVRLRLCTSILAWMQGAPDDYPLQENLETERVEPLRHLISDRLVLASFLTSASRVFSASEGKRNATTASEMVSHLVAEGQAAAEMTVILLGENTNKRFNQFLFRIMRIGTIVDTLLDAEDDFKSGLLPLAPNRIFRWRLKFAIGWQLPGLIVGFPDRLLLWRYCLSYIHPELNRL